MKNIILSFKLWIKHINNQDNYGFWLSLNRGKQEMYYGKEINNFFYSKMFPWF